MKNLVIGLLFLGFTNLTFSQNDMAYVNVNPAIKFDVSKKSSSNLDFIKSLTSSDISKRIISFQKVVADYNIKADPVYIKNNKTTYTVTFKEATNEIENIYNKDGEILSSNQAFSNIRLPYRLSSKVALEHPGWSIKNVSCTIAYELGENTNIFYKVKLKNGSKTKTLKIIK
ncbi:hypothetical protein SAMN05428642_102149 [Flaviramulus basaltis]|uniref:Nicotinate-nucleotide adenylyltransferase n=1 Tax=Flaviramulus basaltis TaxID=369401 RepID=A0A1K2IGS3_9FLAO|nr:hypothetical protein [Flaviramulus basaltis]SFZ91583.1 hypothetical protein SAMN05428642_102149 [Flaviramulus basaltis]